MKGSKRLYVNVHEYNVQCELLREILMPESNLEANSSGQQWKRRRERRTASPKTSTHRDVSDDSSTSGNDEESGSESDDQSGVGNDEDNASLNGKRKRRPGRMCYLDMYPQIPMLVKSFIAQNGFAAHSRRRITTGRMCGVTSKDIRAHLLEKNP